MSDQCTGGVECQTELNGSTSHYAVLSWFFHQWNRGCWDGVHGRSRRYEVKGDKTGDEAAIVTSGDNVANTKDDNGVSSSDKTRGITTGGEAVAVETDNETVDVGVEDKLVGVPAGDEHCNDRSLIVTNTYLMSGSVFREGHNFWQGSARKYDRFSEFYIVCICRI
ncbi:hypothetical protein J6590_052532 [Homalodisca vitripennis]|nr:hypothetical protein J6590_052532 [Homalodisca vitripennis]